MSRRPQPGGTARRTAARRAVTALGAVLVALLLVTLLLEAGLRVAGWVALRSRLAEVEASAGDGKARTILCVGDSWTYGLESGDPGRLSYPARLQRLLDRRLGPGRYRVINAGRVDVTSTEVAQALPGLIARHRPQVVIFLAGGLNWVEEKTRRLVDVDVASAGWLGRARVVQLIRMLLRPSARERSAAMARTIAGLTREVVQVLESPAARADGWGTPPLSMAGCTDRRAAERELRAALRAPPGALRAHLRPLVTAQPDCRAALTVLAENAALRQDWARARKLARTILAADPHDPRAGLALAQTMSRGGRENHDHAFGLLEQLRDRNPGYMQVHRQLILAAARRQADLCLLNKELRRALAATPGCAWAREAYAIVRRGLRRPGGHEVLEHLDSVLWRDLETARALTRRAGAQLLLLSYPPAGLEPCRATTSRLTARYAARKQVPLADLGAVLDPARDMAARARLGISHPNAAGYLAVARLVEARLVELGWVGGH